MTDRKNEIKKKVNSPVNEEAKKRPAEREWCAKEVVAHLLYTERWYHINLSLKTDGQRFPGFSNDLGCIAALASSAPTVSDLLDELKYAEKVTALMIENFSDEFVARKVVYNAVANWVIQGVEKHSRSHFPQIQEAIAIAREA